MTSCLFQCYFKSNCIQKITYTWSIPVQNQGLPNSLVAHFYSVLSLQCDIFCWTVNSISGQDRDWAPCNFNLTGSWLVESELYPYLLKSEIPGLAFLKLVCRWDFLSCWVYNLKRGCGTVKPYEQPHLAHSSLWRTCFKNTHLLSVIYWLSLFNFSQIYADDDFPFGIIWNFLITETELCKCFLLLELCTSMLHHSN